ncbi:MAG: acetate kinase, partial [Kiritimatiellae bacterium]|nr:acetate kinase [Kiritimatiellia bacterium]
MKKTIRKVLVVNSGSSSLKYQLFDMEKEERLAKGLVERIGAGGPANHAEALKQVVADLGNPSDIDAVGHRVLHGAEIFKDSAKVTKSVMNT